MADEDAEGQGPRLRSAARERRRWDRAQTSLSMRARSGVECLPPEKQEERDAIESSSSNIRGTAKQKYYRLAGLHLPLSMLLYVVAVSRSVVVDTSAVGYLHTRLLAVHCLSKA